jgi:TRAP transporter 4TM/12TM fusion protein
MQSLAKSALAVLSILMVAYHAIASQYLYFGQWEHQTIHLAFLYLLVFLSFAVKAQSPKQLALISVCLVVGLVCCTYVYVNVLDLESSQGFPTEVAVIVGCCLILVTMAGTYLCWGLPLLLVAAVFVGYFFLGHLLGGPLHHPEYSFDYVISYLTVGLSGLFGTFLSVSVDQVFLFVVFGSILSVFKVDVMFMEIGKTLGRLMRGGAGMTAVVSDVFIGMVSGAPVASVAIVGPFVMPYMRKSGYDANETGAIVACAATGSQMMPPVMGAAAFMMATFIGGPYAVSMVAGLLPALFYYFANGMGVQCMAVAKGFQVVEMTVDWRLIGRRLPVFVTPIAVIAVMLLMRYSPAMTAFWACVAAIVLGMPGKETRPTLQEFTDALKDGALTGAKIGISLALIGMVAQTLVTTGMGTKLANLVAYIADGRLFITLLLTMIVALILGCAVPPVAAYALCAIVVVPTMAQMGVAVLPAHMFCFYFSIIAAITPPVGLACLAAAGISGGDYWNTSWIAVKLAVIGFVLPFMIVYNPLFAFNMDNPVWTIGSLPSILLSIMAFAALRYRALVTHLNVADTVLCAVIALMTVVHIFGGGHMPQAVLILIPTVAVLLMFFVYYRQYKRVGNAAEAQGIQDGTH